MGVDPRFDPVFQRGYDPKTHRTRIRPETPRPEPRREDTSGPHEPPIRVETVPSPTPEAEDGAPPRRNPFRLALLLASLAAIGGAAALLWHRLSTDPYYYYSSPSDREALFADIFVQAAIPALVTAGVVGLAVWFALGALRRHDGV